MYLDFLEDYIYKEWQKDVEEKKTNLTFEEYYYYVLHNQNGICIL